jgi:hypothetical protein
MASGPQSDARKLKTRRAVPRVERLSLALSIVEKASQGCQPVRAIALIHGIRVSIRRLHHGIHVLLRRCTFNA